MRVFKTILIVLVFACLSVGLVLAFGAKIFVSKKKNTQEVATRKVLRTKLIGYVLLMASIAFAIFQSLITV